MLKRLGLVAALIGLAGCQAVQSETNFQHAVTDFRAGRLDAAQAEARQAYDAAPQTKKYAALLGWTYLKRGDLAAAGEVLAQLRAIDARYIETIQLGAWHAFASGDSTAAARLFKEQRLWAEDLLRRPDGDVPPGDLPFVRGILADAHHGLGLIALAQGDGAAASAHLRAALAEPSYVAHADVEKALAVAERPSPGAVQALLSAGKAREAARLAAAGAAAAPDEALYKWLAPLTLAAAEGREPAPETVAAAAWFAPELLRGAVARYPAIAAAARRAGTASYAAGNFAGARALLAALGDGGCETAMKLNWSAYYAGAWQDAATGFKDLAARRCRPEEEAVLGYGVAELALLHFDEADRLLRRSAALNPGYIRARVSLGAVPYLKGDYAAAIRVYAPLADKLPKSERVWSWGSNALNNLGWSHYFTGDYAASRRVFERLAAYHDGIESPPALAGLGWTAWREGAADEARRHFTRALALDPNLALAQNGMAALKSGQTAAR
jgi:tetratricopeptide (TPR) repeat protein